MNTYEAFVILKPILDVDNSDNVLKVIEDGIESLGGKVTRKEKLGRKRLAYEINKFKDGFIITYLMTLPPSAISELKQLCKLNDDILRVAVVNRSHVDMTDPAIYGRERPMERTEHRGGERSERPGEQQREYRPRPAFRSA